MAASVRSNRCTIYRVLIMGWSLLGVRLTVSRTVRRDARIDPYSVDTTKSGCAVIDRHRRLRTQVPFPTLRSAASQARDSTVASDRVRKRDRGSRRPDSRATTGGTDSGSALPKFVDSGERSRRNQIHDFWMAFADSHQVGFILRSLAGPT